MAFWTCVETLAGMGVDAVIEIGPDTVLGPTVATAWPQGAGPAQPAIASSMRRPSAGKPDPADGSGFLDAVAATYRAGIDMSFEGLFAGEARRRVALPGYRFQHHRYWVEPPRRRRQASDHRLLGTRHDSPRGKTLYVTEVFMTDPALATDWWEPFTQVDDVALTHVDLVPNEASEQEAWTWLDGEERHRAGRFRHTGARRRYVLCRASLRSLLCGALDCGNQQLAFGASEHGKPFATVGSLQAPIAFNVSHSGPHGLIALAPRGPVGVDVEERASQRNLDVLVDAVLGPRERAEVMAASGRRKLDMFLDLWTLKEALSKAHGMGLSLDVSSFEIPPDLRDGDRSGVFRLPCMPDVAWRLTNIGTDRFAAAVAHEQEGP